MVKGLKGDISFKISFPGWPTIIKIKCLFKIEQFFHIEPSHESTVNYEFVYQPQVQRLIRC